MAKPQYSSRSPSTCLLHKLRDQNRPLPECFLWCVVMNDCVRCTAYCGQSLLWVDFCFACLQHPLPPCGNQTGLQVQTLATTAQMSSTAKRGTGRVNCFLVSDTRFNRFKIASIICPCFCSIFAVSHLFLDVPGSRYFICELLLNVPTLFICDVLLQVLAICFRDVVATMSVNLDSRRLPPRFAGVRKFGFTFPVPPWGRR